MINVGFAGCVGCNATGRHPRQHASRVRPCWSASTFHFNGRTGSRRERCAVANHASRASGKFRLPFSLRLVEPVPARHLPESIESKGKMATLGLSALLNLARLLQAVFNLDLDDSEDDALLDWEQYAAMKRVKFCGIDCTRVASCLPCIPRTPPQWWYVQPYCQSKKSFQSFGWVHMRPPFSHSRAYLLLTAPVPAAVQAWCAHALRTSLAIPSLPSIFAKPTPFLPIRRGSVQQVQRGRTRQERCCSCADLGAHSGLSLLLSAVCSDLCQLSNAAQVHLHP